MAPGEASDSQTGAERPGLRGDLAYTAVFEDVRHRRERAGWYLGLAKRHEAGYYQLRPGFGPYPDHRAAMAHADELNGRMRLTPAAATEIVLSTIRAQRESA